MKTLKKIKPTGKAVLILSITAIIINGIFGGCKKETTPISSPTTSIKEFQYEKIMALDSAFIQLDSTDTVRTFTIYDNCDLNVGTITTNGMKTIQFTSQTSTTVTITGTTSKTLNKGSFYYFKPNLCSSGNYILKVKFNTGTQTLCNYFKLTNCTWTAVGSCGIVNSYAFVASRPTPC
jgi:hypothetical protein